MKSSEALAVQVGELRVPSLDEKKITVLKPFITKAYKQKVKLKASGDDAYNGPDHVLRQARAAHGRNMAELTDMELLRRSRVNTSMVRLQAEDYIVQRSGRQLTGGPSDDSGDEEGDDAGSSSDAAADEAVCAGRAARRTTGGSEEGNAMTSGEQQTQPLDSFYADCPPIVLIHGVTDDGARRSSTGGEAFVHGQHGRRDYRPNGSCIPPEGTPAASTAAAAVALTPTPPVTTVEVNRRADDLLNRYRQFDRGSTGLINTSNDLSIRSGSSFTAAGGIAPGALGLADYSTRGGGAGGASRLAPWCPRASDTAAGAGGYGAGAGEPPQSPFQSHPQGLSMGEMMLTRRTRSSSSGMAATVAAMAGDPSTSGKDALKRGISHSSLLRQGGANGALTDTGTTRGFRNMSPSLDPSPPPGDPNLSRLAAARSVGGADRSVTGRRSGAFAGSTPAGLSTLAPPPTGQPASSVLARASEASLRPGGGGGGGGSVRVNALLAAGLASMDSDAASQGMQLPDLTGNATPAAAALFRAITGAEPVGRAALDGPERSGRSVRGPQLQHQFLNAAGGGSGGPAASVGYPVEGTQAVSRLRAASFTNPEDGLRWRTSSFSKLPTIATPSSLSPVASPAGGAAPPFARHSLAANEGVSPRPSGGVRLSGQASFVANAGGGYGRASLSYDAQGDHASDEAGLVSKVKGLFGKLKR